MSPQHHNIERFESCTCDSPAKDPVRYEFPDGSAIDMAGCVECGGLVEWKLDIEYDPDDLGPDHLDGDRPDCRSYHCENLADVVVQLRRDLGSITAYCDECWADRKKNSGLRIANRQHEVLGRYTEKTNGGGST